MVPADDGASPAPIDRSVLERMRARFAGSPTTESAMIVEAGRLHLQVELSTDYYPEDTTARFEIRWYRNDDFTFRYRGTHRDSTWQCRWDRHSNTHNSRDHVHPPPDASRTDAETHGGLRTIATWPRSSSIASRNASRRSGNSSSKDTSVLGSNPRPRRLVLRRLVQKPVETTSTAER